MLLQPPLLSVVPSGVLDMTADFAPLFVGLVVGLGLCVLGLVFAIGIHDTWWAPRKVKTTAERSAHWPEWHDAA
ncbi:MAG TPA: hypothetical protein VGX03_16130 [Candidatus Binatia bacterium]|nr:hypothetical protein [Candidatus Binatia bacterium]